MRHNDMKNRILLIALCCLLGTQLSAQKKKADNETLEFRYEAESAIGQAVQGFTLVKVYSYSKSRNVALAQTGKNAVHAVLFKGVSDYNSGTTRIKGQKPIISNPMVYDENRSFFAEQTIYSHHLCTFFVATRLLCISSLVIL